MMTRVTSRDQFALLSWVASEFGGSGHLGKKAVQKIIHILDEGMYVNSGYDFSLHLYGAFSRDLAGDIDIASSLKAINVVYASDQNAYIISKGDNADRIILSSEKYLGEYTDKLSYAAILLKEKSGRELELYSTFIFLIRRDPGEIDSTLIDELLRLKPKYDLLEASKGLSTIRSILHEVNQRNFEAAERQAS